MSTSQEERALQIIGAPPSTEQFAKHYASEEVDHTESINKQIDEQHKWVQKHYQDLITYYNHAYSQRQKRFEQLEPLLGKAKRVGQGFQELAKTEKELAGMRERLHGTDISGTGWVDDGKGNSLALRRPEPDEDSIEDNVKNQITKLGVDGAAEVEDAGLKQSLLDSHGQAYDRQNLGDLRKLEMHYNHYWDLAKTGLLVDVSHISGTLSDGSPNLKTYDSNLNYREREYIANKIMAVYIHHNKDILYGRSGRLKRNVLKHYVQFDAKQEVAFYQTVAEAQKQAFREQRAQDLELRLKDNPSYFIDYIDIYKGAHGNSYKLARIEATDTVAALATTGKLSRATVEKIVDTEFLIEGSKTKLKTIREYWPIEAAKMLAGVTAYEKGIVDSDQQDTKYKGEALALQLVNTAKKDKNFDIGKRNDTIVSWMQQMGVTDPELVPDSLKNLSYAGVENDASLQQQYDHILSSGGALREEDLLKFNDPDLRDKYRKKVVTRARAGGSEGTGSKGFIDAAVGDLYRNENGIVEKGLEYFAMHTNATAAYNRKYEEVFDKTGSHVQAQSAAQQEVLKGIGLKTKTGELVWGTLPYAPIDTASGRLTVKAKQALLKDRNLLSSETLWVGEKPAIKAAANFFNGQGTIPQYYRDIAKGIRLLPNGKVGNAYNLMRYRLEKLGEIKENKWVLPEEENLTVKQQIKLSQNTPSSTYQVTQENEDLTWMLDRVVDPESVNNGGYDYLRKPDGEIAALDKPLTEHTLLEIISLLDQGYTDFGIYGITNEGLRSILIESPVDLQDTFDKQNQDLLVLARLRQKTQQAQQYSTNNAAYRRLVNIRQEDQEEFLQIVGDLPPYLLLNNLLPAVATEMVKQTLQ